MKTLVKSLVALAFAAALTPAVRAADLQYEDLPEAAKTYAETVRATCKDADPDGIPANKMAGITQVTLSDGTPALLIDNEYLCDDHYSGANCTNRGCDTVVMTQSDEADKGWKEILHEHLYAKDYIIIGDKKLKSITARVYAGDPHCGNPPDVSSCPAIAVRSRYATRTETGRGRKPDNPGNPGLTSALSEDRCSAFVERYRAGPQNAVSRSSGGAAAHIAVCFA